MRIYRSVSSWCCLYASVWNTNRNSAALAHLCRWPFSILLLGCTYQLYIWLSVDSLSSSISILTYKDEAYSWEISTIENLYKRSTVTSLWDQRYSMYHNLLRGFEYWTSDYSFVDLFEIVYVADLWWLCDASPMSEALPPIVSHSLFGIVS